MFCWCCKQDATDWQSVVSQMTRGGMSSGSAEPRGDLSSNSCDAVPEAAPTTVPLPLQGHLIDGGHTPPASPIARRGSTEIRTPRCRTPGRSGSASPCLHSAELGYRDCQSQENRQQEVMTPRSVIFADSSKSVSSSNDLQETQRRPTEQSLPAGRSANSELHGEFDDTDEGPMLLPAVSAPTRVDNDVQCSSPEDYKVIGLQAMQLTTPDWSGAKETKYSQNAGFAASGREATSSTKYSLETPVRTCSFSDQSTMSVRSFGTEGSEAQQAHRSKNALLVSSFDETDEASELMPLKSVHAKVCGKGSFSGAPKKAQLSQEGDSFHDRDNVHKLPIALSRNESPAPWIDSERDIFTPGSMVEVPLGLKAMQVLTA